VRLDAHTPPSAGSARERARRLRHAQRHASRRAGHLAGELAHGGDGDEDDEARRRRPAAHPRPRSDGRHALPNPHARLP